MSDERRYAMIAAMAAMLGLTAAWAAVAAPTAEDEAALPKHSRVWDQAYDDWDVEPFCGASSSPLPAAYFQQGPRLEAGGGGSLVVAEDGTAYVAGGTFVYRVGADDRVELLAGVPGISGWRDGPANRALFGDITALRLGPGPTLYAMEQGMRCVRTLTPDAAGQWTVGTLAGSPRRPAKRVDGPTAEASFEKPCGITRFDDGRIFIMDNSFLRVIENGVVRTLNAKGKFGFADGPLETAQFKILFTANCLASDGTNTLYVADMWNNVLRKIDLAKGEVSSLAGGPPRGTPGSGMPKGGDPFRDGPGMWARFHPGGGVTTAYFDRPTGRIYMGIADDKPHVFGPDGWLRTLPERVGLPMARDAQGRIYSSGGRGGGISRLRRLKPGEKPFEPERPPEEDKPLFQKAPFDPQSIPRNVGRVSIAAPAEPPVVDGKLDDACWAAAPAWRLTLANGQDGPEDIATEWRMLADQTRLYIAAVCREPAMEAMGAPRREHDDGRFYTDDYLEFFLIPSADPREPAYQIMVNSAGQTWDGVNKNAKKWNPKIAVGARREAAAWSVELSVPLAEIPGAEGGLWRMNAGRYRPKRAGAKDMELFWSLLFTANSHHYERFNVVAVEALGGKLP